MNIIITWHLTRYINTDNNILNSNGNGAGNGTYNCNGYQ